MRVPSPSAARSDRVSSRAWFGFGFGLGLGLGLGLGSGFGFGFGLGLGEAGHRVEGVAARHDGGQHLAQLLQPATIYNIGGSGSLWLQPPVAI